VTFWTKETKKRDRQEDNERMKKNKNQHMTESEIPGLASHQ
jgi:hypothetical protein